MRKNFEEIHSCLDLLRRYFVNLTIYVFSTQGRAEELTRDLLQKGGLSLIVVVGGDGTIAEVVNAVLTQRACETMLRIGIFPAGTANVFARELGISSRPEQNVRNLMQTRGRVVYPSVVATSDSQRLFVQMASAGADAFIVQETAGGKKENLANLHTF